ncbi:MAG: thiamine-binding protein [Mycobacteriales bacterium]
MIVEIQVLPSPAGTADNAHAHVEAAIAVIQQSGLTNEVGPLGTSVEGAPDDIWPLLRAVHQATLAAGAENTISVIKVAEGVQRSMDDLTRKFRP